MEPGKEIGRTLEKLLQIVLEDPEENSREKLMEYVKGMTS
jgi:tRNA nucleotidyltransferase (CCA-adding enzyme)